MDGARGGAEPERSLELGDGVARIPAAEWNALVGDESPFLEWEWLASLEEAGCVGDAQGWQARPLLLREGGRLVAACPLYVKGNSEGEFVFDWGWADAAARAGIAYYPKLLVGVPFTPVAGARFLCAPGADRGGLRGADGAGAARSVRGAPALVRARELLPRGRDRAAAGRRLPAAHRRPVPLAQRGLRELRRLPRAAAQQAPQPGAARAPRRRASRASRPRCCAATPSPTRSSSRCTAATAPRSTPTTTAAAT